MTRYAVLALLSEGPDYGYSLKRRFERRVGASWNLNIGQVYSTLRALKRSGLVSEVGAISPAGRPERRTFTLTAKGKHALERWLDRRPVRSQPWRDETLVRLLVLQEENRDQALRRVAAQGHVYKKHLGRLQVLRRDLPDGDDPVAVLMRLSVEAAVRHAEAHVGWLEYCRQQIEQMSGACGEERAE